MFENNQNPTSPQAGQVPPWKNPPRPNNPVPPVNPKPYQYPGQNNASTAPEPGRQAYRPAPTSQPMAPNQGFRAAPPPSRPNYNNQPANEAEKDWGPLKPIRKVPKPDEEKLAYVLAKAERVAVPEEKNTSKRWTIIGSIIGILVVGGGTAAFIFFGRNQQSTELTNQQVVTTNTNSSANSNLADKVFTNQSNVNSGQANVNQNLDSDSDGLPNAQEIVYGTDPIKPDTDGDGYLDGVEVQNGYDPLIGGNAKLIK